MFKYLGAAIIALLIAFGAYSWWQQQGVDAATTTTINVSDLGTTTINASQKSSHTDGLVGYWSFDGYDISGTTAYDRSGNGNNGTLTNGPTKTIGKVGQAMDFDGVNDYISFTRPNTPNITLSAWVKNGSGAIYGNWQNSGNNVLWNGSSFAWVAPGSNHGFGMCVAVSSPPINEWTHVAVTYSGNNNCVFYYNGVLISDNVTFIDNIGGPIPFSGGTETIGLANNQYYYGSIDEVRVYNRALSADEITNLYNSGVVTIESRALGPYFTCGTDTVEDADSNVYNTVLIGDQCWMATNLNVGTRVALSTNQTDNATIEKWCYSNTDANCDTNNNPNHPDGGLYQWDEAMQYSTTAGAQGICPTGWHIPTHDEFTTLERAVCTSGTCATDFPYDTTTTGYRGTNEGTKLKPNGTSGFEGNLAGYGFSGSFANRGTVGIFWSSSESGASAWYRALNSVTALVLRDAYSQLAGFSVRCLKD